MKRFYWERREFAEFTYAILDRRKSNVKPMAWTDDVHAAEVIVEALNALMEDIDVDA